MYPAISERISTNTPEFIQCSFMNLSKNHFKNACQDYSRYSFCFFFQKFYRGFILGIFLENLQSCLQYILQEFLKYSIQQFLFRFLTGFPLGILTGIYIDIVAGISLLISSRSLVEILLEILVGNSARFHTGIFQAISAGVLRGFVPDISPEPNDSVLVFRDLSRNSSRDASRDICGDCHRHSEINQKTYPRTSLEVIYKLFTEILPRISPVFPLGKEEFFHRDSSIDLFGDSSMNFSKNSFWNWVFSCDKHAFPILA